MDSRIGAMMGAVRCRPAGLVLASILAGVSLASAEERTLVVGTKEAEPFVLRSPSGALRGISVDLWRSVAADLELEYRYLAGKEFAGRIDVLPHLLEPQAYAFGVPAESPLRERINRSVLRHTEDDT